MGVHGTAFERHKGPEVSGVGRYIAMGKVCIGGAWCLIRHPTYIWKTIRKPRRMKTKRELTAIIEREGNGYVSLCPELDVASQGDTIEEARTNLIEALELFFETASEEELKHRFSEEVLVTRVQVAV